MAIIQTKKQTDLEKRLKILRQQVYGKNLISSNTSVHQYNSTPSHQSVNAPISSGSDISYLYKDLTKILILATLAITFQAVLFVLVQRHLINLSF